MNVVEGSTPGTYPTCFCTDCAHTIKGWSEAKSSNRISLLCCLKNRRLIICSVCTMRLFSVLFFQDFSGLLLHSPHKLYSLNASACLPQSLMYTFTLRSVLVVVAPFFKQHNCNIWHFLLQVCFTALKKMQLQS